MFIKYKFILTSCSFTLFCKLRYDIRNDEANTLSDMVMDALAYYVDVQFLDTPFEIFMLLVRKIIEWVVENPSAIGDPDIVQSINLLTSNLHTIANMYCAVCIQAFGVEYVSAGWYTW